MGSAKDGHFVLGVLVPRTDYIAHGGDTRAGTMTEDILGLMTEL